MKHLRDRQINACRQLEKETASDRDRDRQRQMRQQQEDSLLEETAAA